MTSKNLTVATDENFNFRSTVYSHGWSELLPFELDETTWRLKYVFEDNDGVCSVGTISEAGNGLVVEGLDPRIDLKEVERQVRHLMRLDDDLEKFYRAVSRQKGFGWIRKNGAGRLLRSPIVFEDLVKTLCTTNCSWGLTRSMVGNLVNLLGNPAIGGGRSFPTADAMASVSESFYRQEIKAGYRSPYFVELAESVASGKLDPESWLFCDRSTEELRREIKSVKGVGDYAADNLLKLLGRYDGLALDSWLRAQFYKKYNGGEVCDDASIKSQYEKFGEWQGLVMWCEMTEKWIR